MKVKRTQWRKEQKRKNKKRWGLYAGLFFSVMIVAAFAFKIIYENNHSKATENEAKQSSAILEESKDTSSDSGKENAKEKKVATIVASGDMLYHDVVYEGAFRDGAYHFENNYAQIKELISSADLALGDFEGTINPAYPLSGYPQFNAPEEVVDAIKEAGYDAIDLAHNHILDTGIDGLNYTKNAFEKRGIQTFGVNTSDDHPLLIQEINGIKVAVLGFSYGFNGLEETLTQEEYDYYLKDLNMEKVKAEIQKAEETADITVVMPQMGIEYSLEPTDEQREVYHQMVDFGADIIFGGHPHVAEPTEILEKEEEKKFIIYSMGNLLSNQRYETLENYWTERGVIPEVEITKENGKTTITNIKVHPTWVSREPIGGITTSGYTAYDYQVLLAEDYIEGGKKQNTLPAEKEQRIVTAYEEMMQMLNLQWTD